MQIDINERELELLHYCIKKEVPANPTAPEEVELADLEARLTSMMADDTPPAPLDTQALYANGYRQEEPYWGIIDEASIDRSVCSKNKCENCGHQGMDYKPFIRDEPRSYRAFAVCPECGASFEF